MRQRDAAAGEAQWFHATSGWVWAGMLALTAVTFALIDLAQGWHAEVSVAAVLAIVVAYVVLARPAVGVMGEELVVRHMVSTERGPLAAVRSVRVKRVLEVRAGDRTILTPAVSRSLRQTLRGAHERDPEKVYADFVEIRLESLAGTARDRAGIASGSKEQHALGEEYARSWAWPEIGALVGATVLLVALIWL